MAGPCAHIESLEEVIAAKAHVCVECMKTKSSWVHLRTCQTCGSR